MATEISESQSQQYALSDVIAETLAPATSNDDSTDWRAYRLAQLLEESMRDRSQMGRLIKNLTAMHDALVQQGGAA